MIPDQHCLAGAAPTHQQALTDLSNTAEWSGFMHSADALRPLALSAGRASGFTDAAGDSAWHVPAGAFRESGVKA